MSPVQPEGNRGSTDVPLVVQPEVNSSSPSASAISDLQTASSAPPRPKGASGAPLILGRRIKVWRWQVEEIMRALGDQVDRFGPLDEWWQELDGRDDGMVTDNWAYIHAATLREAVTRGCVLADTSKPAPPANKRISGLVAGGAAFLRQQHHG